MSNGTPGKCWACGKFLFGENQTETKTNCPCCSLQSCGECVFNHVRKAHPSWYMANVVRHEFRVNMDSRNIRAMLYRPGSVMAPVIRLRGRQ